MPAFCLFYGFVIQLFWMEHPPPHFHAFYAEFDVLINIQTLEVVKGSLPRRAMAMVLE
jgi:hypothetical protein